MKNGVIIAKDPKTDGKVSVWNFDASGEKGMRFSIDSEIDEDKETRKIRLDSEYRKTSEDLIKQGAKLNNQGNPVDDEGRFIVSTLESATEIAEEDFLRPYRNVELPGLDSEVDDIVGGNKRKVIIKRNIFQKNLISHPEIGVSDNSEILDKALYNPYKLFNDKPQNKPNYWVLTKLGDKTAVANIDTDPDKTHIELVGWRFIGDKGLRRLQERANREGGQVLITKLGAADLSALRVGSSGGKVSEKVGTGQTKSGENAETDERWSLNVAYGKETRNAGIGNRYAKAGNVHATSISSESGAKVIKDLEESKELFKKIDRQGRHTPLSERFNSEKKDMRFSIESYDVPQITTDAEANEVIDTMKANAEDVPYVKLDDANWESIFGKDNSIYTPIGKIKLGENQQEKFRNNDRAEQFGMAIASLTRPDIILEEKDVIYSPLHKRDTSYLFVKTFQKNDGSKYVHFESVTVAQDDLEVSISSHMLRKNALINKLKRDKLLYKATALDASAKTSAGQLITGGSLSSGSKVSEKVGTGQTKSKENAEKGANNPLEAFGLRMPERGRLQGSAAANGAEPSGEAEGTVTMEKYSLIGERGAETLDEFDKKKDRVLESLKKDARRFGTSIDREDYERWSRRWEDEGEERMKNLKVASLQRRRLTSF